MKASFLFAATLLLTPALGSAQVLSVKPGLWEHSVDLKSESGRLEMALEMARTQMALLPPAQRQMMENMLAQQGVKFDIVNQRFQNCITEEEAATGQFTFAEEGGCRETSIRNEGSTTHVSFVCSQGQGQLVLQDGASYTGQSSMTLNFNGLTESATQPAATVRCGGT
ncbi:MAG: DUF3617 domain-containing protein, partial [Comamonas sp.]|nr:DUF3617 domain-containing protein [Comamonas sp.]